MSPSSLLLLSKNTVVQFKENKHSIPLVQNRTITSSSEGDIGDTVSGWRPRVGIGESFALPGTSVSVGGVGKTD